MDILIVTEDFKVLEDFITKLVLEEDLGHNYARFTYQEQKLDVLISGYGGNFSMYAISKALATHKYDLVLHFGQCYSLKDQIVKGQTVCVIDDYFGDIGVGFKDKFQSIFDLQMRNKNEQSFRNEILENNTAIPEQFAQFRKASAITCNSIPDSINAISNAYLKNFPDVISREGANILYCCSKENVKLYQLFYVIERLEKGRDVNFIPEMKSAVNDILEQILEDKTIFH